MKSRHALPLALITIVVGALTAASMLLIDWYPDQASEQAPRVDHLLWFLMICSAVIFTGVTAVLIYCAWRFRVPEDDESEGPPNHGNTRLEIIWTVIPILLLVVVAVWAVKVQLDNEAVAADQTAISVTARQFVWEFDYPGTNVQSGDLRVPVGKQVRLDMRSPDVIHSFWVPEIRFKQDVVPGRTTHMIFDPTKVGTYPIICAELCGAGHGLMRGRLIVMPQAEYDAWLNQAKQQVAAPPANAPAPAATPGG
ncbi:MAG: cytochrome c oxidase subunit II [Thermoleophilia bacterium]|nr:cytochrome c oxidase subunit II [Thermoleophilia bacterium]